MAAFWYKTITDQYRLRIGRQLMEEVQWLSTAVGSTGKCTVIVGTQGQAMFFPDGAARELQSSIEGSVTGKPVTLAEVNEPWLEYLRFLSAQWNIAWGFETAGDRFVFYLTRELYDRGILPDEKQKVAVFATRDFFEVWKPERWIEHAKELGRDLSDLTERAKQRLEDRI